MSTASALARACWYERLQYAPYVQRLGAPLVVVELGSDLRLRNWGCVRMVAVVSPASNTPREPEAASVLWWRSLVRETTCFWTWPLGHYWKDIGYGKSCVRCETWRKW